MIPIQANSDTHGRRLYLALAAAALVQAPWPCLATVTVAASGTARYEYDSNVFDLQNGFPVPGTSDFQKSDTLYTYGAAVDVNYLWDRQQLFVTLSDNEFRYDRFTQLNHNEYILDGGLNWKLGSLLSGTLEALRNRTMIAFTNVENSQFGLQTEQRESGKIDYAFLPDWRIEGRGTYRTVGQVFLDLPDVNLDESSGTLEFDYVGRAGLTAGLSGGYTNGDYTGSSAALNPSYRQTSVALTGIYEPTGRSKFNGAVGYSDRKSTSALNSISGFTGELDYKNQLTGKTSVQAQISRGIVSYVASSSSEIDTSAAASLHWQTTYKLGVVGSYSWTNRNLPGQGNAPLGSNRDDHLQYATINLDYEVLRWLSIKPYINYQIRKSDYIGANFNASIVGISFTGIWEDRRQPDFKIRYLNQPPTILP